jgi:hypothetical protein
MDVPDADLRERAVNWIALTCFAFFFVKSNTWFGWNRMPQSVEELLADGICLVLLALSFPGAKL